MKPLDQRGAIHASVLLNILLGAGIIGAVIFLVFPDSQVIVAEQPVSAALPVNDSTVTPPAPDENQINQLKSTLEIETLKLERLRIQTERVRASQRRAQSVAPDTSTEINQAAVSDLSADGPAQAKN